MAKDESFQSQETRTRKPGITTVRIALISKKGENQNDLSFGSMTRLVRNEISQPHSNLLYNKPNCHININKSQQKRRKVLVEEF